MADIGRPTLYTKEIGDSICDQMAGGMSLSRICKQDGMPKMTAVFSWLRLDDDFAKNYARASDERTEAIVEEAFDIADDGTNDYMQDEYMKGKTPGYQLNGENIQRSKLRVDLRKWHAAQMKPKKYGSKLDVTSDGEKLEGLVIIRNADNPAK